MSVDDVKEATGYSQVFVLNVSHHTSLNTDPEQGRHQHPRKKIRKQ